MKILNLTEGSFPINLEYEINSIDVPNIGKLKRNISVNLSISKVSKNLLKSDGNIQGIFEDTCQNCLEKTNIELSSDINVTLKDLQELDLDSSDQDQTHYQDIEYFDLQKFIEEEIALNYPDIVKCNTNCLKEDKSFKEKKNLPFKKIRDLID
ncbi:MAG: YceD family protein [SAR86 cluster bacterium]|nr:YceD family protein [SAR86 cluster bacterium]